jgi:hypothetical protein
MFSSASNISSPDGELETFWLLYKSVLQKITDQLKPIQTVINIKQWSDTLNEFCADKKYEDIEKQIEVYIIQSGWVFIKYGESYIFKLFVTHLKRWRSIATLCATLNNDGKHKREYFKHINDKLFDIYVDILTNINSNPSLFKNKKYAEFKSSIPIPNYDDVDSLESTYLDLKKLLYDILPFFINDKRERCIDIIFESIDMVDYVMKNYSIKLTGKTSARKLLQLIDKYTTTNPPTDEPTDELTHKPSVDTP